MPAYLRGAARLLAASCLLASGASAATAPPYLDLLRASGDAPPLAASAAELDAAEARLRQARAWRNPELSLELENLAGSGPYRDLQAAEGTVALSQTVELGGKRQARISVAGEGVAFARAAGAVATADYAARLAVAYGEAEAADARVRVAEEMLASAQADARAAGLLVEVGKEAALRSVQAQAAAAAASADLAQATAARTEAFAALTATAGSPVAFDTLGESLLSRQPSAIPPGQSLAVTAAEAQRNAAASQVRLERSQAAPDLRFSAGFRRFEDTDASAAVFGVSAPLPLFDRNREGTRAAQADLRAAEARLRQARLEAEAARATIPAKHSSLSAQVDAGSAGEAAATEAYRLARLGYQAGKLPLLELTATRRGLAEARARAIDARLERLRLEADAARLAGRTPFGADQ